MRFYVGNLGRFNFPLLLATYQSCNNRAGQECVLTSPWPSPHNDFPFTKHDVSFPCVCLLCECLLCVLDLLENTDLLCLLSTLRCDLFSLLTCSHTNGF